jgi:chorismate lyase / 3-hydroxybenzoate synthase
MKKLESPSGLVVLVATKKEAYEIRSRHRSHILRETFFANSFGSSKNSSGPNYLAIPSLSEKRYEFLISPHAVICERVGLLTASSDGEFTLLRMEIEEGEMGVEVAVYRAYQRLFSYLGEKKFFHLVRIWNYIPKVLTETNGLERYRQFNLGRSLAWKDFGPKSENGEPVSPAATGIGSADGPIIIECLISKIPGVHIQNPRQIPAHLYSHKFGPKPPVFSRATVVKSKGKKLPVFISGTASLVGEEVIWKGDPQKQTEETLKNISVLISKENLLDHGVNQGFNLEDLSSVRVYIKRKSDYLVIKNCVEKLINPRKIIYLHNEICRPGFLVEIEALIV